MIVLNEIKLPELGEGIEKATVAFWHYQPGQRVNANDDLVEVVTDKATFNVPADVSGILKEIRVSEGREARIGEVLALIESS